MPEGISPSPESGEDSSEQVRSLTRDIERSEAEARRLRFEAAGITDERHLEIKRDMEATAGHYYRERYRLETGQEFGQTEAETKSPTEG